MRIMDYETNKSLNDVAVYLTKDEAAELVDYLQRLVAVPEIHTVHLSEIHRDRLERELTVAIDPELARSA